MYIYNVLLIAGVLEEARFYGIEGLVSTLENMVTEESKRCNGTEALNRRDVLKAIMSTPATSELRFQGVNLAGADLSRLDLRNINFKVSPIVSVFNISIQQGSPGPIDTLSDSFDSLFSTRIGSVSR